MTLLRRRTTEDLILHNRSPKDDPPLPLLSRIERVLNLN